MSSSAATTRWSVGVGAAGGGRTRGFVTGTSSPSPEGGLTSRWLRGTAAGLLASTTSAAAAEAVATVDGTVTARDEGHPGDSAAGRALDLVHLALATTVAAAAPATAGAAAATA